MQQPVLRVRVGAQDARLVLVVELDEVVHVPAVQRRLRQVQRTQCCRTLALARVAVEISRHHELLLLESVEKSRCARGSGAAGALLTTRAIVLLDLLLDLLTIGATCGARRRAVVQITSARRVIQAGAAG